MHKILSVALAVMVLAALPSLVHATAILTFYETGCTAAPGAAVPCPAPGRFVGLGASQITFPYPLATLTVPDGPSAGTAFMGGPGTTPTYTGDPFTFSVNGGPSLSPAFNGAQCSGGPGCLTAFDLSWSLFPGRFGHPLGLFLDSIYLQSAGYEIAIENSGLGPQGNWVGSDFILGGCFDALCRMTGYWQGNLAVPEPASAALLLTGLLVTWVVGRWPRAAVGGLTYFVDTARRSFVATRPIFSHG